MRSKRRKLEVLRIELGPASFRLEFIDNLGKDLVVHERATELVTNNLLQLVGVERNDVLLQHVYVHICGVMRVGDGRVRRRDHFCPVADVRLVDLLDHFFEFKLWTRMSASFGPEDGDAGGFTLAAVFIKKLWNSKPVPKNEVMVLPNSANVRLESSSCNVCQ